MFIGIKVLPIRGIYCVFLLKILIVADNDFGLAAIVDNLVSWKLLCIPCDLSKSIFLSVKVRFYVMQLSAVRVWSNILHIYSTLLLPSSNNEIDFLLATTAQRQRWW